MNSENKLEEVHDFSRKLLQPSLIDRLRAYVRWQQKVLNTSSSSDAGPDFVPISINLDLTTACNYRCDHCIDSEVINKPVSFDYDKLLSSLDIMSRKGLESVILIGGGEPTLYPKFEEVVKFLKQRNLDVAIVSNGSNIEKIKNVASLFGEKDWVTLSLDSGTNETFQKIHRPRVSITLDQICHQVYDLKTKYPNLSIRYAYVVRWNSPELEIKSNIEEIPLAAQLARDNKFDFLALKAYLKRDSEDSTETIMVSSHRYQEIREKIKEAIKKAKELETEKFKVRISTNLRVLQEGKFKNYRNQPRHCHIAFFRQVLSPLGVFICPGFRGLEVARIGDKDAYSTNKNYQNTKLILANKIRDFDASQQCRKVTCLYNSTNWFIENLIKDPEGLSKIKPQEENNDYFL